MFPASSLLDPQASVQRDRLAALRSAYESVRRLTEQLCQPLATEDFGVQAMPDVSPPKWHLAHTTWFFETFLLARSADYSLYHPRYPYLFNSYYEGIGPFFPRRQRGMLSRPTVSEIYDYRRHVDGHMLALMDNLDDESVRQIGALVTLGINHEQQHQELLLMDVKYNFAKNPLLPAYREDLPVSCNSAQPLEFIEHNGGIYSIGYDGAGFAYDNETPRHRVYLEPYRIASRPVTNGEFIEFIRGGGYNHAEYWLSDGWREVKENHWRHPLYWQKDESGWQVMTLGGLRRLDDNEPVCHVSFYEADAFARWRGKRMPTEAEWETAAQSHAVAGNFLDSGVYHPVAEHRHFAFFGNVWEWTRSAYSPYPGYRPPTGAIGEYNGKFMSNQMVLRGGSCVTPANHLRASYRNFFYPAQRWQFSGFRLAENVE